MRSKSIENIHWKESEESITKYLFGKESNKRTLLKTSYINLEKYNFNIKKEIEIFIFYDSEQRFNSFTIFHSESSIEVPNDDKWKLLKDILNYQFLLKVSLRNKISKATQKIIVYIGDIVQGASVEGVYNWFSIPMKIEIY